MALLRDFHQSRKVFMYKGIYNSLHQAVLHSIARVKEIYWNPTKQKQRLP